MSRRLLAALFSLVAGSAAAGPFFPFCIDWHDAKKRTFEQQASMLKELGYEGVGHLWLDRVDERIKSLDAAGLKLFQITMKVNIAEGTPPYDAKQFAEVLRLVKGRQVQFCLLISGGKPSDPSLDARAVAILREMSALALDSGAQLLLYPHLNEWMERVEDAVRVAGQVDRPNVGVMFNLCHWLRVGPDRDYKPLLEKAMPRLWAVSINGADVLDEKPGWGRTIQPLDAGDFDLAAFLKTLRELGYDGPVGLQCYGIGGDARDHLARSMKAWRNLSAAAASPAFSRAGKGFAFDTGALRGNLHAAGHSTGLTDVLSFPAGEKLSRSKGLFSHYRLLTSDARFGDGAWDWPSTADLRDDGAVEVRWPADAGHPFDMTAVYRWASTNALDVTTTVVARQPLRALEVFLASYFEGFPAVYGYGTNGLVEVREEHGDWLAFTRDNAAEALVLDGRWQRPPHPVVFKPLARYAGAMGMRRDAKTGLTALIMAPPEDCFAVLMPYGEESHRSLYLSLFGRDFKEGESATARARLILGRGISDAQAVEMYQAYLKQP